MYHAVFRKSPIKFKKSKITDMDNIKKMIAGLTETEDQQPDYCIAMHKRIIVVRNGVTNVLYNNAI